MTHVTNYAHDRLALVLFDALFRFVQKWTQLKLIADRPLNLGRKYFEIFPQDKMPVWTVSKFEAITLDIWVSVMLNGPFHTMM